MAKVSNPFDDKKFNTVAELEEYVKENYGDKIPSEYRGDIAHFLYDYRNEPRKCQVCGLYTDWNPKLKKYNPICSTKYDKYNSKYPYFIWGFKTTLYRFIKNRGNTCEQVMRKTYLNNIKNARGTDNLMADPEYQKYILNHKKIAHNVIYKNKMYVVIGSYEKLFLEVLSYSSKPADIEAPGPTITIDGKTTITDFYFPKYNLIVSIKDIGDNPAFENNYKKSCFFYYNIIKEGKYNIIELNGTEQIKRAREIIKSYIKGEYSITDTDIMPIYMEKYEPEMYEKLKQLDNNRKSEIKKGHIL